MSDFTIAQGDTQPIFQATLVRGDGTVQDLTGATVKLTVQSVAGGTPPVSDATCVVVNPPTAGVVQYQWLVADTATPGDYLAEFHVTLPGGQAVTFPTLGELELTIRPKLP